jgi:hypothetical protein
VIRSDVATDLNSTVIRKSYIQNGHFWLGCRDTRQGLFGSSSLTHNFHVVFSFKESPQTSPNYFVIVQQENAQAH